MTDVGEELAQESCTAISRPFRRQDDGVGGEGGDDDDDPGNRHS